METNDPSPEQIAALCEAIRAKWSEAERRKRSAWATSPGWVAPSVEESDFETAE